MTEDYLDNQCDCGHPQYRHFDLGSNICLDCEIVNGNKQHTFKQDNLKTIEWLANKRRLI